MRKSSLTGRNKPKKPISFWVWLSLYAFFGAFIVVQSCLPAWASSAQSDLIAQAVAFFVNAGTSDHVADIIEPTSLTLKSGSEGDSTYLPAVNGVPQIGLGTTTRLWFTVSFPYGQVGVEDDSFEATATKGSDCFRYATDAGNHVVRITALKPFVGAELSVKVGKLDPYLYAFDAVTLPAPTSYNVSADKTTLKINEVATLAVTSSLPEEDEIKFLRYYDPSLLSRHSSDESVVTVDAFGSVLAKGEGTATVTLGTKTVNFVVSGSNPTVPATGVSVTQTGSLHVNDFGLEKTLYGAKFFATLTPSVSGVDEAVNWSLSDNENNLEARLIEKGADPDSGRPYCLVQGYRTLGEVTVTASLVATPSVQGSLVSSVTEIVPTSFSLLYATSTGQTQIFAAATSSLTIKNTASLYLKGAFGTIAPTNGDIEISSRTLGSSVKAEPLVYGDASGTITISFVSAGDYSFVFRSVANPTLTAELSVNVEQATIDSGNGTFQVWVRKNIGHLGLFLCFAVAGVFFWRAFYGSDFKRQWWKVCATGLGIGLGFAMLSEAIQLIPVLERGSQWADVGIDMIGFSSGFILTLGVLALVWLIRWLVLKKKDARSETSIPKQ